MRASSPHCGPDTSAAFDNLVLAYQRKRKPLDVSFRDLVAWLPYSSSGNRYTHGLHSYPAKLIPHIPNFFLNCSAINSNEDTVLDPFSGTGTVALEAVLSGRRTIVCDSNPLARLIAKVKTTPIAPASIRRGRDRLKKRVAQIRRANAPDVVNIDYWFLPKTVRQLARVAAALGEQPRSAFATLCDVAFSATVRKMSLTDPRISVPVRLNPLRYPSSDPRKRHVLERLQKLEEANAILEFFTTLDQFSTLVTSLWSVRKSIGEVEDQYSNVLSGGAGSLSQRKDQDVGMIVTSPPYLGAQKYIRFSSLSMGWLSIAGSKELRAYEDLSIGREHFPRRGYSSLTTTGIAEADLLLGEVWDQNPLRAHIAACYLNEMREALGNTLKTLKSGGKLVLVSGCNSICGRSFETTRFLRQICLDAGVKILLELSDTIKSRGLMTKRNKTAGLIPLESVIVFEK